MKKKKERIERRKRQQIQTRWLIIAGMTLALSAALWLVLANKQNSDSKVRPISRFNTQDFHSLAFSLTEPETIFFGHHGGLLVSRNGGKDWESTTLTNADAMALGISLSNPQMMYAAGHDVFFKSIDGGKSWDSVSTNLPGSDIHGFAVATENENHVFAHVVGFGIFESEDGGNTWKLFSDTVPSSTFNLAVGKDSQTLYVAAGDAGLLQSLDGGKTWVPIGESTLALTYVPASNRLYITTLGSSAGLYYSEDGGQTWTSLGLNGTFLAIAVSPLDVNHIIVVNDEGEVFASRDAGSSWTDK
ncbi:MAG: hypothetical protein JNM46_00070 [Anaerolineales bacterium]|nr:hypothetical protein [Anaerolineales bacterium]